MLWTYLRDGRQTSYEVNQSEDGSHFELKRHEDGRVEVEIFEDFNQLEGRIRHLRDELAGAGWSLAGTPPVRARISI